IDACAPAAPPAPAPAFCWCRTATNRDWLPSRFWPGIDIVGKALGIRVIEEPLDSSFDISIRLLQCFLGPWCIESHGAQHLDGSRVCCCMNGVGTKAQGGVYVWIVHVYKCQFLARGASNPMEPSISTAAGSAAA